MDEKELEKILKALANKRRLLILKILKRKKKISVGNMAKEIKLSFKSTSKHFAILYSAGIVEKEQISLSMYYSIIKKLPRVVSELIHIL